jgi:hypothetical protein
MPFPVEFDKHTFLPERVDSTLTIKDAAPPGNNRRPDIDPFPVRFRGIFLA